MFLSLTWVNTRICALAYRNCVDWQNINGAGWCYLDLLAPRERNLKLLQEAPHSQLPVCKGDMPCHWHRRKSRYFQAVIDGEVDFTEIPLNLPLFVPASLTLIDLLRALRQYRTTFALVVSEFGVTEGIVTLGDVMLSLVGEMMPLSDAPEDALAVPRPDGSWLLDGLLAIDEMQDKQATGAYSTLSRSLPIHTANVIGAGRLMRNSSN